MNSTVRYTINPLFDFQIICDTDIGLYRLIKKEYYDKSIFKKELFETSNEVFIKALLLTRKYFNPLHVFCKDKIFNQEELDDLYNQFLTEEYDKILELSTPTDIFRLAVASNTMQKIVNLTILCNSDKEVQWVDRYNPRLKCIVAEYRDFDITEFDTLYIKDLYTLLLLKQDTISRKNIIFPRFNFNLENTSMKVEIPKVEVTKKYHMHNRFSTVDPYRGITAPVSEMI